MTLAYDPAAAVHCQGSGGAVTHSAQPTGEGECRKPAIVTPGDSTVIGDTNNFDKVTGSTNAAPEIDPAFHWVPKKSPACNLAGFVDPDGRAPLIGKLSHPFCFRVDEGAV